MPTKRKSVQKKPTGKVSRQRATNPVELTEDEADVIYSLRALKSGDFVPFEEVLRENGYELERTGPQGRRARDKKTA